MERLTLITKPGGDYELLDSGKEEKLERYGNFLLARPDPQALWEKGLGEKEWADAHGRYTREGSPSTGSGQGKGKWFTPSGVEGETLPKQWDIKFGGLTFIIKPTSFKHTGLFPEQLSNWNWMQNLLRKSLGSGEMNGSPTPSPKDFTPKVLNLFAYTGGATLAAAQAGASVTHVDASKTAVAWARENAERSGLSEKPIRWITEDVLVFVKREIKRGSKYDAIIMDPPAFGHGPKDELWKIEENLLELIKLCMELLSDKPLFVLINGYAAGYSPLAFAYNLESFTKKFGLPGQGGSIEFGDLTIEEKGSKAQGGATVRRLLPAGIFARWSNSKN